MSNPPDANTGPFRLLMRVPVPWVFVLTYLIGVGLEYVWPLHFGVGASTDIARVHGELARDAASIGAQPRHNLLAVFSNPRVLLLGAIGCVGNGAGNGLLLSVPAVLAANAGLETGRIGTLVSVGGILGIVCILLAGWNSDRSGDRFRDACVCAMVLSGAILLIGVGSTPALVVIGYLLFAATFFTGGMLVVASWADVLPVGQLAVGGAAINTLWQIGNFLSPYAWGIATDATGNFRAGLIGASVLAAAEALLILYVRTRILSERREMRVSVGAA